MVRSSLPCGFTSYINAVFQNADNYLDRHVSKDLNFIAVRSVAAGTYFNSFTDVLFSTMRKVYCSGLLW